MPDLRARLADRLASVEGRIVTACRRAGRSRADVTLIAVTKTVPIEVAALLPELGVRDLAENRPQELWAKAEAISDVRWHMIGHFQRNKVERTLPLVSLVHSLDSERLADTLAATSPSVPALLQVNISREPAKYGFAPDDLPAVAARLLARPELAIQGLMGMAAYSDDPVDARPAFAELRQLAERLRAETGRPLTHLSMGMSGDFEVAIEEGATLIRLGTVLFEGVVT